MRLHKHLNVTFYCLCLQYKLGLGKREFFVIKCIKEKRICVCVCLCVWVMCMFSYSLFIQVCVVAGCDGDLIPWETGLCLNVRMTRTVKDVQEPPAGRPLAGWPARRLRDSEATGPSSWKMHFLTHWTVSFPFGVCVCNITPILSMCVWTCEYALLIFFCCVDTGTFEVFSSVDIGGSTMHHHALSI